MKLISARRALYPYCLPSVLSEYHFKRESDGGLINHTIIVAKTYVLTSQTTLFQRYDSTLKPLKNCYAVMNIRYVDFNYPLPKVDYGMI